MRPILTRALGLLLLSTAVGAPLPALDASGVAPAALQATSPPGHNAESLTTRPGAPEARPFGEPPTGSLSAASIWFFALLLVGVAALPLAYVLFPHLDDRGAGFARVLGLALSTFLWGLLLRYRLLQPGGLAAWVSLCLLAAASLLCFSTRRREMAEFWRQRWRTLLVGEAVFAIGFLLFVGLRSFNPEICWGEKPMDFSILNILVRTRSIPPSDPWFSGAPLGYYVFGQEMVAFLTLLTGLSTRYTFNLAFGLVAGAAAQCAFCLARGWAGRLRAGVAGAAFTLVLGNLAGLREWLVNQHLRGESKHLDWHYFWATSRVVPDTVNEYPLWSLLFADLHAHLLALPLLIMVAASALQLLRAHADPGSRASRRLLCALVLGFTAAVEALTNAWDIPLLGGLFVLLFCLTAISEPRPGLRALSHAVASFVVALGSAFLFLRPLWVRGGGLPGFGWNWERPARGADVLTQFGFFFFVCLTWWAVCASAGLAREGAGRGRRLLVYLEAALMLAAGFWSAEALCAAGILLFLVAVFRMAEQPEDRLAFGLIATAFFLVLFAQRLFIYDRMNTFFKLYFEAWPLFALATAVLLFRSPNRAGAFENWPGVLRGAFFLLLACGAFTSVTAARGGIFGRSNPSRPAGGPGRPSLDGLRYLEKLRPGEYRAVLWLSRTLTGTPVVLEAQGGEHGSYQDFSRVSMLTGLPTVLGWEHHVKQRGNPEAEVLARRQAIQEIYSGTDPPKAQQLLRRYHVGYVYVGWLEKRTYPAPGLKKFDTAPELFQIAYENPEVKIYRVVGGDSQDVISPAREALPPPPEQPRRAEKGDEPEEPPSLRDTPAEGRLPFSGMREPRDAAVDDKGRLWVADFGNSRLRIFNAEGGYLGGWGGRGSGNHGFRELCGVAIRGDNLYVADTWNGRVQYFTLAGQWKATVSELYGPRGVAAAPDGNVWVTDTGNNRLMLYDSQLADGRVIGKKGSGPGEFAGPVGIAAAPSGSVYVADTGNRRVQVLDSGGHFLRAFPVVGWTDGAEPHVEVDADGTAYVSVPPADAVQQYDASGAPGLRFTADPDGRKLARPTGLAIDRKRRMLYVINSGDNTVSRMPLPERKER
jgi:YYY domain-containing protein